MVGAPCIFFWKFPRLDTSCVTAKPETNAVDLKDAQSKNYWEKLGFSSRHLMQTFCSLKLNDIGLSIAPPLAGIKQWSPT